MNIYIYGKCSTCQKAIQFLKARGIPFTSKEITQTPPSLKELHQMLRFKEGQLKKLFNTSGMLYKEMQLSEKLDSMPLEEALSLLHQNGMLVKRPFLIGDDFGLTGFNETEWLKRA